jgi:hypothetical protein
MEIADIKRLRVDEKAEADLQEVLQIALVSAYRCPSPDGSGFSTQDKEFLMSWTVD